MHAATRRGARMGALSWEVTLVTVGGSWRRLYCGALLRSERRGRRFEHWVSECHAWLLKYGLREENVRRVRFIPAKERSCTHAATDSPSVCP